MALNGQIKKKNNNSGTILSVRDLSISLHLAASGPPVKVIDSVSFEVGKGEILGIVGESGSGKSVTSQAVLRLLPSPPWNHDGGRVLFAGRDLYSLDREEMRKVRGKDIAVVLQEPMTSLNPYYTIGEQIEEVLTAHLKIDRKEARSRAVEALNEVGVPGAPERAGQYPHQLSGGLKQRAMIAAAFRHR
jgi:peptide/nickel transport system ATP-binding protein